MANKHLSPKGVAVIAYLTPFGLIAAYFINQNQKNDFAGFHIKNMFGITLLHYIGVLLGNINLGNIHEAIFFMAIFFWIISFIRLLFNQKAGVPFLDQLFQQWFKFLD